MLLAVKYLGDYIVKRESIDETEIFVEKAKLGKTLKVIVLNFSKADDIITYTNSHLEDYQEILSSKYIFRAYRHQRYDVSLTTKISYKQGVIPTVENLKKRWVQWFNSHLKIYGDDQFFTELNREFNEKVEAIFEDFTNVYKELPINEMKNSIATIKFIEKGEEYYLGEVDFFRELFQRGASEKFYIKYKTESKGEGICILCQDEKEVYGFALPFSFYTFDKKGFASQFQQAKTWKQLPLCRQCAMSLTAGKEFLDKYLFKKFYGKHFFYIIPKCIFGEFEDGLIEDIMDAGEKDDLMSLLGEEDQILDIMKDQQNYINLIFIFCKSKQSYYDAIKYVEDVPPSWIKIIYKTFREITLNNSLFREEVLKQIMGAKWANDYINGVWDGKRVSDLNLGGLIRSFFQASKDRGKYTKYLIDIMGDILAERIINKQLLFRAFMREISYFFRNNNQWMEKLMVLKSFYLYLFLAKLNLIKNGEKKMKNTNQVLEKLKNLTKGEKLTTFFSEFEKAFDTSEKKALFSEGVLVAFLLNIQFAKRNAKPFREKLYGLKLDQRRVKKLFPEMVEKLRQYDIAYPWLEQLISMYMIDADNDGWSISKDEISYYFTLGMNLAKMFKDIKESETINE